MLPTLYIQLFGEFRLVYDEQPVTSVDTPRLQSLLAYLLLHRESPQSRRHLAFLLFSDSTEAQARTNLRNLLHHLRQALPDADRFLFADAQTLQWRLDAPFTFDVDEFECAVEQANSSTALRDAVALYRGDLLPGCYDDWIVPERERLRQKFIEALERLLVLLEDQHDYHVAIPYAERSLRQDPLREETYRLLMRLHALSGDRAGVLRVYQTCTTILERELGADASPATREAYEQLVRMEIVPARPTELSSKPRSNNLPLQLSSFIGREKEIAEIKGLFTPDRVNGERVRLLTLTGAGGSGKTRLALQVGGELLDEFPDGVWFVNLAPLTEAVLVIPTMVQTLGVSLLPKQTALEALQEYLRGKWMLLVLDNFEQVLDAAPNLAALQRETENLKMLVTSRAALHLSGEREFRVPPMAVPDLSVVSYDGIAKNEAVALFVARAKSVRQDFELSETSARAVAEICVRVDGLPLAIELAAARTRVLAPEELLARLSSRLGLLTGGARDLPARQQTLRNTIDWSFNLLTSDEQKLFARLGVFVGGWVLEEAEKVCWSGEGNLPGEIVDLLQMLADHNLIQQLVTSGGSTRFNMLETLREYALGQLQATGELERMRQRHAEYYLALVEVNVSKSVSMYLASEWGTRVNLEQDNLRSALAWSVSTIGNAQMSLRLSEASAYFTMRLEERIWLERALAHAEAEEGYDSHTLARVLCRLGTLQSFHGDYASGESTTQKSLAIFQQLGDREWTVQLLERCGWSARERGDLRVARSRLEEALALAQESNFDEMTPTLTNTLSETITMHGDTRLARRMLEESLPQQNGDNLGWTLNHLGHIAQIEGEYVEARRLHGESLALFLENSFPWGILEAQHCLGEVALAQGDGATAMSHLEKALAQAKEIGYVAGVAWSLAGLAGVAVLDEEPTRAAFLWGAAEHLREQLGVREGPAAHAVHERLKEQSREDLGDEAFHAAWARGEKAAITEVVADILRAV